MNRSFLRFLQLGLFFLLLIIFPNRIWAAGPRVQIRSPQDRSEIAQEQNYVLVSGKVTAEAARSGYVDIFLVLDVSGSTAHDAGVDFPEFSQLPNHYVSQRDVAGGERSLDLEIFLEREKSLELEVEKLGKISERIQKGN